jgi:hypothetical protein
MLIARLFMVAVSCGLPGLAWPIKCIMFTNSVTVKGVADGLQPSSNGRRSFSVAGEQLVNRINKPTFDSLLLTEKVLDKAAVDGVGVSVHRFVPNRNPNVDLVPQCHEIRGGLGKSSSSHKALVEGRICCVGRCYAGRAGIGCHLDVDGLTGPVGPGLVEDCLVKLMAISKVEVPTTKKQFMLAH